MFVVTKEHMFWWPVTVKSPDPEKVGAIREETFTMRFKAMPKDEAEQLEMLAGGQSPVDQTIAFIKEVAIDWSDVVDAGKNAVSFDATTLNDALLYPWVRAGILTAYSDAISGRARLGN